MNDADTDDVRSSRREQMTQLIATVVEIFLLDPGRNELEFPSFLTDMQRSMVQELCVQKSLHTRCFGRDDSLRIVASKSGDFTSYPVTNVVASFTLSDVEKEMLGKLLVTNPVTATERSDTTFGMDTGQNMEQYQGSTDGEQQKRRLAPGRLSFAMKQVPPALDRRNVDATVAHTRAALPIAAYRAEIQAAVRVNQVVLVVGMPGAGKTTQVPQYILEDAQEQSNPCRVVVGEPRRIAAVASAQRVFVERADGAEIGQGCVGYQVELESRLSVQSLLTYCTNSVLVRTVACTGSLDSTSHVVLDDVHERSSELDILVTAVRELLRCDADLRLVILSAPSNVDGWSEYFSDFAFTQITVASETKQKPVEYFLEDIIKSSISAPLRKEEIVIDILLRIVQEFSQGSIAVHTARYADIVAIQDAIDASEILKTHFVMICAIHSEMRPEEYRSVLDVNHSKGPCLFIGTEFLEASVPLVPVACVIDYGTVDCSKLYDLERSVYVEGNPPANISKQSAKLRSFHATDRVYRLYSRMEFEQFEATSKPLCLRASLADLCLSSALLSGVKASAEHYLSLMPSPPPLFAVHSAFEMLTRTESLLAHELLSEIGRQQAEMAAMAPQLTKLVLYGVVLKCLDPVLTIACCLQHCDVFVQGDTQEQRAAAFVCKRRFGANAHSDHMAMLRAYQEWQRSRNGNWEAKFCTNVYISKAEMEIVHNIRTQLLGQLRALGFVRGAKGAGDIKDLNINSERWHVVKAALTAGLYPNIGYVSSSTVSGQREINIYNRSAPVSLHRCSVATNVEPTAVDKLPTRWLVYDKLVSFTESQGDDVFIRNASVVTPQTIALFAGPTRLNRVLTQLSESAMQSFITKTTLSVPNEAGDLLVDASGRSLIPMQIDDWIILHVDAETLFSVTQLRMKLHAVVLRKLRENFQAFNSGARLSNEQRQCAAVQQQRDDEVVKTVVQMLYSAEVGAGLTQPEGIGQRPRSMAAASTIRVGGSGGATASAQTTSCHFPAPITSAAVSQQQPSASHAIEADTRYFVIKCLTAGQIDVCVAKSVMTVHRSFTDRLFNVFKQKSSVVLLVAMRAHRNCWWVGYCRMVSTAYTSRERFPVLSNSAHLDRRMFAVKWLKRADMSFSASASLVNAMMKRRLNECEDGEEVDRSTAERLLQLWSAAAPVLPQSHHSPEPGLTNSPGQDTTPPRVIRRRLDPTPQQHDVSAPPPLAWSTLYCPPLLPETTQGRYIYGSGGGTSGHSTRV